VRLPMAAALSSPARRLELAAYETQTGSTIVLPSVIAHSVEITRATVRVESTPSGSLDVQVSTTDESPSAGRASKAKLDADSFDLLLGGAVDPSVVNDVAAFRESVSSDPRMKIAYAAASMIVRFKPTDVSKWLTGLVIYKNGEANVGFLDGQLKSLGLSQEIGHRFARETAELIGVAAPSRFPDTWGEYAAIDAVLSVHDEFLTRLRALTDEIEQALSTTPNQ
jgi:hypothetical protein